MDSDDKVGDLDKQNTPRTNTITNGVLLARKTRNLNSDNDIDALNQFNMLSFHEREKIEVKPV